MVVQSEPAAATEARGRRGSKQTSEGDLGKHAENTWRCAAYLVHFPFVQVLDSLTPRGSHWQARPTPNPAADGCIAMHFYLHQRQTM